ncbi:methyltransferase domain-containing protein [Chroococcidiopsis sp. CCMEE 29]|uniref:class I SAM-dependent methyltransferase n=1 Tax=Chroococcidiopsis sp. CCMEE 29 TaxID=155894 RepID=UPI002021BAEC|nr:methyltransferase domain-containing protein [Chroococcidiopsis sp. CCMEE 29]
MNKLKIDLGCGPCKKEGTIGIDVQEQPGVDCILDLQSEPLPFPDKSVEYVYSSHFLEHVESAHYVAKIFAEISRVCVDGAELEFWTPYTWSNSAFIFGHNLFFNEDHYLHPCVWHYDFWEKALKGRWLLKEITYIINPDVLVELYRNKISIDFAQKYYKGIVREFGVFIEVRHEYKGENLQPKRTFAVDRSSKRYPVKSKSEVGWNPVELENAFEWFSSVELERSQAQTELEQFKDMVNVMQMSKFWKLRTAWFNFKKSIGLVTDTRSI